MMLRLLLLSLAVIPIDTFVPAQNVLTSRLFLQATANENKEEEHISITYCTGCRWLLRSAWLAQELLTTFQDELDSVTLIPSRPPAPGGIFTVRRNDQVIWDRKEQGGFPESKELKQRIRNLVSPEMFLGHLDTPQQQEARQDCVDCESNAVSSNSFKEKPSGTPDAAAPKPNVGITYCTGCRWLLRAAWIAQELLTTFETEIASVTLIPSRPPAPGGIFLVMLDGNLLWDRTEQGRFPQPKELKQIIRDQVAPDKNLGHSDTKQADDDSEDSVVIEPMDEDEASDLKKYFGVM